MKGDAHLGTQARVIFPDSWDLPGTLVSGCCKSGLSASEDTDHISKKRRIGAYRLREGDRQGEKREGEGESEAGLVVMSGQHILQVI